MISCMADHELKSSLKAQIFKYIFLFLPILVTHSFIQKCRERSGSVVECLTRDEGPRVPASPASLCCVLEHSLVLVQPRKTHPYITERLLIGC